VTIRPAVAVLVGLLLAGVGIVGIELAKGALGPGPATLADPCKPRTPFPRQGFDATIQGIVLDGLDGAACRLRTSREELVLSLRPGPGRTVRWDRRTIETAIRAGLLRALDDAERRGELPGFVAPLLRQIVERAPIDKLVEGGIGLRDLLG
jgi:hypothetical protein